MGIYMKYDNAKGAVTTDDFKCWIELESFEWGSGSKYAIGAARRDNREHSEPTFHEIVVTKIGGTNVPRRFSSIASYTALCALQGIALQKLEITSEGDIDLRGFFGLDPSIAPGIASNAHGWGSRGDGTEAQFQRIRELVLATSPISTTSLTPSGWRRR